MSSCPPKSPAARRLERVLLRKLQKTCERYSLLSSGDRVAVAISGGKDSSAMLALLTQLQRALPFRITLRALHLDQHQPGYNNESFVSWLRLSGFPFEVVSEDTYSVVKSKTSPGDTYCALCSRLRRGALYTSLERIGFNKLALGHHRDDALETFMMNQFFSGKLQAMPASYTTDCGRYQVIRPLIETAESLIAEYAEAAEFPILPCNLCGSQEHLQRKEMKRMLTQLELKHPNVRAVMLNALGNIRPTHLLDQDVGRAWAERDPSIRPEKEHKARPQRMQALPVLASERRLPLIQ